MRSPVFRGVVWAAAILVCAAGIWMSMHLALMHHRTSSKDTGVLDDVCTGFETSSCQKVGESRWAWFPPKPPEEEETPSDQTEEDEAPTESTSGKRTPPKSTDDEGFRIPTAQLGLIYFSAVLCWLVFTGPFPATRRWPHMVFVAGTLAGVPASIFYEIVMWTQLDVWCPLCVGTHAGSILLPIFALLLWPREAAAQDDDGPVAVVPPQPEPEGLFAPAPAAPARNAGSERPWPTNYAMFAAVVSAGLLIGLQNYVLQNQASIRQGVVDKYYREHYQKRWMQYERHWIHNFWAWSLQPVINIPIESRPVRGPADAPHTIVVFSDFECPSCARFEHYLTNNVLQMRLRDKPGFKLIFKHWPLSKDCNDEIESSPHPAACEASLAVEAARMVGGDEAFWKMHDLLFATQSQWRRNRDFLPYARRLELDETAFVEAMNSSEALDRVRQDIADGANLGGEIENPTRRSEQKVDSTPTVFVDGKRLNSPQRAATWRQIMNMPVRGAAGAQGASSQRPKRPPATRPAQRMGPVIE